MFSCIKKTYYQAYIIQIISVLSSVILDFPSLYYIYFATSVFVYYVNKASIQSLEIKTYLSSSSVMRPH